MKLHCLLFVIASVDAFAQNRIITTVAGSKWIFDGDAKPATQAPLGPDGVIAMDSRDNLYIADPANAMVHRVDRQGILTVIAGNGVGNGEDPYVKAPGRSTPLFFPGGVTVDRFRNVFISAGNSVIRWDLGGFLNRVVGLSSGWAGPAVFDAQGHMYFLDAHRLLRYRSGGGPLETVAGTGVAGFSGDDGPAVNAQFETGECTQLAVDSNGNLYICDGVNRRIRRVNLSTGIITTVAGSANAYWDWTHQRGDGGPALQAAIWPSAIAVDNQNNIYIGDGGRIRRFVVGGNITTFAGQDRDFDLIRGLAADSQRNIYARSNHFVRKITPSGNISIFAGNGNLLFGGDGLPGTFASLRTPRALAYHKPSGSLYISDGDSRRVRKLDANGIITTVAGTGPLAPPGQQGSQATSYPLDSVSGLALDALGRLYISSNNGCGLIRVETNGVVIVLGNFGVYGCPNALGSAPDGTVYTLVGGHPSHPSSVWRIEPNGQTTRIAGNGIETFAGDNGQAVNASLRGPAGFAVDSQGRIYISDGGNNRIRRIGTDGIITTFAGNGVGTLAGDGLPATQASLSDPKGLAFDAAGNLYVADYGNGRIRVISPAGIINTFAGTVQYGSGGDAGFATAAGLSFPEAVAVDNAGNVLISDSRNSLVRSVLVSQPTFDITSSLLSFSTIQGQGGTQSGIFVVKPSNNGLAYTVSTDASWLTATPTSGSLSGLTVISVTANPTGLAPRNYEGYVVVTVPGSIPAQRRIKVVFSVLPSADVSLNGAQPDIRRPAEKASVRAAGTGSTITFGYALTNNSLTVSDNLVASGSIPSWLTFVSCTIEGGQCSGTPTGYTARLDDLVGGATARINVSTRLNVDATQANMTSSVTADTTDLNLNNNTAIVSALFESTQCTYSLSASGTLLPASGGSGTVAVTASRADCSWSIANNSGWMTLDKTTGTGSVTVNYNVAANNGSARSASAGIAGLTFTVSQVASGSAAPTRFVPLPPCRIMETRGEYNFEGRTGPFGPPFLAGGEVRTLTVPASSVCRNIPSTAKAFVLNVTLVPRGGVDFVTVSTGGEPRPQFFTVRSPDGLIVANSAIVPAGPGGTLAVYASHATDMLIDISGYFTDDARASSLAFYPQTPCRVIDTRSLYRPQTGPFGPPSLVARQTRNFRFPGNPYCTVPSGAAAYSVTITAVPQGPLQFVTAWPAGTAQPNVSSLNSPNGRILANSVILPASADGSVSLHAFDNSDVIVDINGYYAPDDGVNGLYYYPVRQCRVANTTEANGPFGGPIYENESRRTVAIPQSGCGIPSTSKGYALNATVAPSGSPMPFLTVWPSGQGQPIASVINAFEGQTVSSGFLVPAGLNGATDVFAFRRTHVILEIAGYFGR